MLAASLTITTTAQSLYDLLSATPYRRVQEGFAELRVQADTVGTDTVFIGDQAVSSTNYGAKVTNAAAGSDFVQFGYDDIDLNTRTVYLRASANTPVVHVLIR